MDLKARMTLVGLQNPSATMTTSLKKGNLMCHTATLHCPAFPAAGCDPVPEFRPVECGKKQWLPRSSLAWCKFLLSNPLFMLFLHLLEGWGEASEQWGDRAHRMEGLWSAVWKAVGQTSTLTCYMIQKSPSTALSLQTLGAVCYSSYATLTNTSISRNTLCHATVETGRKQGCTGKP